MMKKPIRILHVNDFDPSTGGGGVEKSLRELLLWFSGNKQFEIEVFSASRFGPKRLSGLYSKKYHHTFIEKVKEFQPDIVHFHMVTQILSPSMLKLAKRMGIKTVLTAHSFNCVCNRTWGIFSDGLACRDWFGLRCLMHNCFSSRRLWLNIFLSYLRWPFTYYYRMIMKSSIDAIISPSQCLAKVIKESLRLDSFVVRTFVRPLDTEWKPNKNEMLYLGRIAPEKGIEILIKAFKIVAERLPDARLKIVGKGETTYINNLKGLAKNFVLENRINFIGFTKSPQYLYTTANIVVIPSLWLENNPLALYEALSMGIPTIGTRRGGIPELIRDGHTGYLFNPGDYKNLADKIMKILNSEDIIESMHHSAKEYFKSNFSEDKTVKRLTQIYEEPVK